VPIAQLALSPYNPRTISRDALARLTRSYARFGCVKPIVVNRRTGRVVAGHQGVRAAKRAGLTELPVVHVDLDESAEKALNVALNNPNLAGEWDFPRLADVLRDLEGADFDLTLTGFDPSQIAELMPAPKAPGAEGGGAKAEPRRMECPSCGYVFEC